jgi:hypothetical protein
MALERDNQAASRERAMSFPSGQSLVPGTRMARIAVRPTWVGVIDFESRLPSALGGVTG